MQTQHWGKYHSQVLKPVSNPLIEEIVNFIYLWVCLCDSKGLVVKNQMKTHFQPKHQTEEI